MHLQVLNVLRSIYVISRFPSIFIANTILAINDFFKTSQQFAVT
jgi:hypothetical protein